MDFKILVVFDFTLHIYLYLYKATNVYRLLTIIFYGSNTTFMVYLKNCIYIYIHSCDSLEKLYKVGSECELNSWSDSSVSYSI